MSSSNCCFLTCVHTSQEVGQVVWHSHLFQNFPQFVVIYTVKGFGVVNKAEVDVFLEFSCFSHDPADVGKLISGSSAFSKSSLNIWNMVHVLLKPGWRTLSITLLALWDEYNCTVVWTFFGIALLWDWNENWPFPVLWPLLSFLNLTYWVQQFHRIIFRIWNSSTETPSPPLALLVVMLPKSHLILHTRMSGSRSVITPSWLSGSWRSFCIVLLCILATFS